MPVPRRATPVSLGLGVRGLPFIWRHKVMLGAISLDLFAVLLGGATALLPIYAKDMLQTGPWGLGLLRAAPAVGALVVAHRARAAAARAPRRPARCSSSVAIYGLAILVFGLSHDFALSMIALAVSGGADMVSVVIRQTLVQLDTPDDMRGRVSAVNASFIGASNELGEFRAGTMAAWIGPVAPPCWAASGTLVVVALWISGFPRSHAATACSTARLDSVLGTRAPPAAPLPRAPQHHRDADEREHAPHQRGIVGRTPTVARGRDPAALPETAAAGPA